MINGQWVMIRGSGLWRGVDPWPRAPGCPGVSIRFEGSLHAMHAVQRQKAVHFGLCMPCKGKMRVISVLACRAKCKKRCISGFARRAKCKMRVISGFTCRAKAKGGSFRALHAVHRQNEGHFGLCMPCEVQNEGHFGLYTPCKGQNVASFITDTHVIYDSWQVSELARRAKAKTWQVS